MNANARIADAVRTKLGLVFPESRAHALDSGIERATISLGLSGPSALAERIEASDRAALDAIASELTIGETYFFRDSGHFDALREKVLRPAARSGLRIRLWSAGCATGEEPYSLAIASLEEGASVEVIATDINERFLRRAESGLYGPWSFRGVAPATQRAWFTNEGQRFRVRPEVAERVRFSTFNLVAEQPESGAYAAAFCRNVLIYFEGAGISAAARALASGIAPGGILFTGPSDPFLDDPRLQIHTSPELIFYQRVHEGKSRAPVIEPAPVQLEAISLPTITQRRKVRRSPVPIAKTEPALEPVVYLKRAQGCLDAGDDRGALDALRGAIMLDRDLAIAHLQSVGPLRRLGEEVMAGRALARARVLLAPLADTDEVPASGGATAAEVRSMLQALERTNHRAGRRARRPA